MHLMVRKFLVIFGAEEADRLSPFNDDKPKRAKICRHKALRVQVSVVIPFTISAPVAQWIEHRPPTPGCRRFDSYQAY